MSSTEPKDLIDVLSRLEQTRHEPDGPMQRKFRRFVIRGDAKVEPLSPGEMEEVIRVQLRDISRGGIGFLCDRFLPPCTEWRMHFKAGRHGVGSQAMMIRYCRLVQDGLYLVGGQFVIEPYLMAALGVQEAAMEDEPACHYDQLDVSEFFAPELPESPDASA